MAHVRDKPPLRLHWQATTPGGRRYRWGEDEPDPENVPGGVSFSTTMPGGFEQATVTLPRKPARDYADLERLTTLTCYGPGGESVWEGRLERAPRVSGDQMAVSPAAVGWQAHLEDNKSAVQIYIDRDLSHWQGPSRLRQLQGLAAARGIQQMSVVSDDTDGYPAIKLALTGPWAGGQECEAFFDAGNALIDTIWWDRTSESTVAGQPSGTFEFFVGTCDTDDLGGVGLTADQQTVSNDGEISAFTPSSPQRFGFLIWRHAAVNTAASEYSTHVRRIAVLGDHDLTFAGELVGGEAGYYAAELVEHAVTKFAPWLNISSGSIQQSQYVIANLSFLEPTTAGEMVRQITRFGLQDWAVWDDREFVWHNRGERGRSWRMRIAPAQLEEAGESVERLYESVIVQYQDVDGTTKTVGPPGSEADTEDDDLQDDDPENPAVRLGITKRALLTMGVAVSTDAVEVGSRFLEEQKQLDASGSAQLVGHVEDDKGVLHPAWRVRAGDTITFVDAADPSPRRIVRTNYDHGSRTCSVDIDAPPEGLQALLERLGADLVQVGL